MQKKNHLKVLDPLKRFQTTVILKSVGTLEEISHFLQIIHSPTPPSQCCDPPSITCYALGC